MWNQDDSLGGCCNRPVASGGMDKGDGSERDKPCLVLKYIVKFSPVEFANGLDVELREESRMTSKFLPEQLEKWNFYLLK